MHLDLRSSPHFHPGDRASKTADEPAAAPFSAKVASGLLLLLDLLTLPAVAAIAFYIRLDGDPFASPGLYAAVTAFGTLLAINAFYAAGMYAPDILHNPAGTLRRMTACWVGVAIGLVALGYLTKTSDEISRAWSTMWFGLGLAALLAVRAAFYARARRWFDEGRFRRNVAIVGGGRLAERLAQHLTADPRAGIRVAGIFADATPSSGFPGAGDNRDGDLDELIVRARQEPVDTVIVAIPDAGEDRLAHVFRRLKEIPVDVRLCPGEEMLSLLDKGVTHYAGVPTVNVVERPLADWRLTAKAIEDRVIAAEILVLIAPIMLAIALLIKLTSKGPVLFRQTRYGFNNELITVYKFRTMYVDCSDPTADRLTERNDPRVTPVGAFLRKWSLDELPQFLNVLRGEMSIVGPRPHALSAKAGGRLYQEAVLHYDARHRMKPGITGWAQINGWRGPTDTVHQIRQRVEHDLYYIENWSLWLDLRIIFLTVFKGLHSKNAF